MSSHLNARQRSISIYMYEFISQHIYNRMSIKKTSPDNVHDECVKWHVHIRKSARSQQVGTRPAHMIASKQFSSNAELLCHRTQRKICRIENHNDAAVTECFIGKHILYFVFEIVCAENSVPRPHQRAMVEVYDNTILT